MKITSSSSGMGYPGGRNSYANGMGPNGFFGAKLGTNFNPGMGSTHTTPVMNMSMSNILNSPKVKQFAKGGAIAGGVMGVATAAGVGMMGFERFFKKQAGIKIRQSTPEALSRGAVSGLAVGAVYGLILASMTGYSS
jgi:hypothetical protein